MKPIFGQIGLTSCAGFKHFPAIFANRVTKMQSLAEGCQFQASPYPQVKFRGITSLKKQFVISFSGKDQDGWKEEILSGPVVQSCL